MSEKYEKDVQEQINRRLMMAALEMKNKGIPKEEVLKVCGAGSFEVVDKVFATKRKITKDDDLLAEKEE